MKSHSFLTNQPSNTRPNGPVAVVQQRTADRVYATGSVLHPKTDSISVGIPVKNEICCDSELVTWRRERNPSHAICKNLPSRAKTCVCRATSCQDQDPGHRAGQTFRRVGNQDEFPIRVVGCERPDPQAEKPLRPFPVVGECRTGCGVQTDLRRYLDRLYRV